MRILVSGISGHVGGAIGRHLVKAGHEVIGVSRSKPVHVQGLKQFVSADLSSLSFVEDLFSGVEPCEVIIHSAASVGRALSLSAISLCNCLGTQQILQLAHKWNSRRFLFVSSIAVIGKPTIIPVTEEHPASPLTIYHASKLYGEHVAGISQSSRLRSVIFRLTAPVGPGMADTRILPVFLKKALADEPLEIQGQGTRRQNYIDTRDIATAVEGCLKYQVEGIFNIGGREGISNIDLARRCIRRVGSSSQVCFSERRDDEEGDNWEVSIAKASKEFGYKPQFVIEDTIDSMVRAIRGRG